MEKYIMESFKEMDFLTITEDKKATVSKSVHELDEDNRKAYEENGIDVNTYLKQTHLDSAKSGITNKIISVIQSISNDSKDLDIEEYTKRIHREKSLKSVFDEPSDGKKYIMNTAQAQRFIYEEIGKICENVEPNLIICNGSIGSSLQDLFEFKNVNSNKPAPNRISNLPTSSTFFKIGEIYDCPVYVDAYMSFNDTKVTICNIDIVLSHNNCAKFNEDKTHFEFGYDIKINPNSKVEVLNIIDKNMLLL